MDGEVERELEGQVGVGGVGGAGDGGGPEEEVLGGGGEGGDGGGWGASSLSSARFGAWLGWSWMLVCMSYGGDDARGF